MKKNLISLVVAGLWVLGASAANNIGFHDHPPITMKLVGCYIGEEPHWDRDWYVKSWSGQQDDVYNISANGTFSINVPHGTRLSAQLKNGPKRPVDYGRGWMPAKEGGFLRACIYMDNELELDEPPLMCEPC